MFSKACTYGLRSVIYLAQHSSESKRIGVNELVEKLVVPKHFLAKVLQQLAREKIISSMKGPNGGFYVTDENGKAKLATVVMCIDGHVVNQRCILGLPNCSSDSPCPLHHTTFAYRESLRIQLEQHTIKEMAMRVTHENFFIEPQKLV